MRADQMPHSCWQRGHHKPTGAVSDDVSLEAHLIAQHSLQQLAVDAAGLAVHCRRDNQGGRWVRELGGECSARLAVRI